MTFVCGPARGKTKAMRCPCCGMESDRADDFAVSMCWECGFGMNVACRNCLWSGVETSLFGVGLKAHLFSPFNPAEALCGKAMPLSESTGAQGKRACRECCRVAQVVGVGW